MSEGTANKTEPTRPSDAGELLARACPGVSPPTCDCRFKALERAFSLADIERSQALWHGATADSACVAAKGFSGLKAEVLARAQSPDADSAVADARAKSPDDAHAIFAAAYRKLMSDDRKGSRELFELAAKHGRGAAVASMLGVLALREGDVAAAKKAFEEALAQDAEDVDALYNLSEIEAAQGLYNKPRARFLKILSLRPDHLDARFALALLTFHAGAMPEANRHQALLEGQAPTGDARVLKLREVMNGPRPEHSGTRAPAPLDIRMRSGSK